MPLNNKINVTWTIALVNALARLHNFCLGMLIPDQLKVDIDYMLNQHEDGHVVMENSKDHGITMQLV
jgi:hypothetical protein